MQLKLEFEAYMKSLVMNLWMMMHEILLNIRPNMLWLKKLCAKKQNENYRKYRR